MHEFGVRKGQIPRLKLLSHVQAELLTSEKWIILESTPFLKSEPFRPNQLTLENGLLSKISCSQKSKLIYVGTKINSMR
jgi:hypothetical protein